VEAALELTDADLLVVHDADVWCDALDDAIEAVRAGAPWAMPHRRVYRLTEDATNAALDGGDLGGPTVEHPYIGWQGGGIVVLPRTTYRDCPLDPRFAGWGAEDEAWARALVALHGKPWRGRAPLWHLWHPPQPRVSRRMGSESSDALLARYVIAGKRAGPMRTLIEEVTREPALAAHPRRHPPDPDED
jgi:hypothetical protein